MAIPPITSLPSLDRTDPQFREKVDTFFGSQIPLFVAEANAYAAAMWQALLDAGEAREGSEAARDQARAVLAVASREMRRRLAQAMQLADFAESYASQGAGYAAQSAAIKASNETIAAAVQSAAGLPSLTGNAYRLLGVLPGESGVGWVHGMGSGYVQLAASQNWSVPDGATWVFVECLGGGGSGGSRSNNIGGSCAGGGGGGQCVQRLLRVSDLSSSVTAVVGVGGAAVTGSASGQAGGDTSFAGVVAKGGEGGKTGSSGYVSGGAAGGPASAGESSDFGGGGGGGVSDSLRYAPGSSTFGGGGGRANGGSSGASDGGVSQYAGSGGAARESGGYPSGGGGGNVLSSEWSGAGGNGRIRIWWW